MLSFKQYLNEALGTTRAWYDTKKNRIVELLPNDVNHDWAPIKNPARFGLKPADVAPFVEDMESGEDEILDLSKLMLKKGWARIMQWEDSTGISWNISANKLKQVHKAALAMEKHFRTTPATLYIDSASLPRGGTFLEDNQIADFLKRGKIIKRTEIGRTMARFR